jgi:hypothetical protein
VGRKHEWVGRGTDMFEYDAEDNVGIMGDALLKMAPNKCVVSGGMSSTLSQRPPLFPGVGRHALESQNRFLSLLLTLLRR